MNFLDLAIKNIHRVIPKRLVAKFLIHFTDGMVASKGNVAAAFKFAARAVKLIR